MIKKKVKVTIVSGRADKEEQAVTLQQRTDTLSRVLQSGFTADQAVSFPDCAHRSLHELRVPVDKCHRAEALTLTSCGCNNT